jgi:HWE histidine kinase
LTTPKEDTLEAENSALRELLEQAGLDASRLLAQAGINATEKEAAGRLQRLLLEELHHRVNNTLATVMAIASQSLRNEPMICSCNFGAFSHLGQDKHSDASFAREVQSVLRTL